MQLPPEFLLAPAGVQSECHLHFPLLFQVVQMACQWHVWPPHVHTDYHQPSVLCQQTACCIHAYKGCVLLSTQAPGIACRLLAPSRQQNTTCTTTCILVLPQEPT